MSHFALNPATTSKAGVLFPPSKYCFLFSPRARRAIINHVPKVFFCCCNLWVVFSVLVQLSGGKKCSSVGFHLLLCAAAAQSLFCGGPGGPVEASLSLSLLWFLIVSPSVSDCFWFGLMWYLSPRSRALLQSMSGSLLNDYKI